MIQKKEKKHLKIGLLVWGSVLIFVFLMWPSHNYEALDKKGEKLDCSKLLADSKTGENFGPFWDIFPVKLYLYDREQITGYTFTQCRAEIEKEQQKRCDYYLNAEFKTNTTFYSSPYSSMDNDEHHCANEITEYVKTFNDKYEIKGNAFIKNGVVMHKTKITLHPIDTWHAGSKESKYYVVILSDGDSKIYLRYGNLDIAREVHQEITDFIAN